MSNTKKHDDDLWLVVQGQGHVPAMKNKKRIFNGRLVTDPKCQRWMQACMSSFASQLHSAFRTSEGATSTVPWQLYAIASLPPDDNWKVMPEIMIRAEKVEKGEEGALIHIEKISPV
jgi:hypothetical protein